MLAIHELEQSHQLLINTRIKFIHLPAEHSIGSYFYHSLSLTIPSTNDIDRQTCHSTMSSPNPEHHYCRYFHFNRSSFDWRVLLGFRLFCFVFINSIFFISACMTSFPAAVEHRKPVGCNAMGNHTQNNGDRCGSKDRLCAWKRRVYHHHNKHNAG